MPAWGPLLLAAVAATAETPDTAAAQGEETAAEPGFTELIEGLEHRAGLLTLHVDRDAGKVWLELPAASPDGHIGRYLYVEGLVTGLGSNPVGLDRGQLGDAEVVDLRRVGGRLLIEVLNYRYRAVTESRPEAAATRESFATSVIWAGEVAARHEDGRALVDLTGFLLRDAHGVVSQLADAEQGSFRLDEARSVVDPDACLAFPDNLELEALLTYAGDDPGPHVRSTAAVPEAFTLRQHHSLIRLPGPGYRPRPFDPRAGSFAIAFADYAAPLAGPLEQRWIVRYRLAPGDELVYYVDPAIPEPVRTAVLEGAGWWAEAFEAAGLPDVYRVELLPEGVHPLDVRYNVIEWVHRSTRGWSYGGGIVDPRTGEMLKGHVNLGSLRVRQDRRIFEGLVGADRTGSGAADDPIELALARIRQLAAHEVGHTLGLAHNFAASTYGRASVMDYPAPLVEIGADGELDLGGAYGVGVGEWDRFAIHYAYGDFGDAEEARLDALVRSAVESGLVMISDRDARPPGAAQPLGSLWDNGDDPAAQLDLEMEVRRIALSRFGADRVAAGRPLALLEEVLATVYFRHRYQLEAAIKMVGGIDYRYAVRGDPQPAPRPLAGDVQRRALDSVVATLDPAALDLPDTVLEVLHPRPYGYPDNRELFASGTSPAFDALGAAATAADLAIGGLLQHERAARLVELHRRRPELPGFEEVTDRLIAAAFAAPAGETERRAEIRRAVQEVLVDRLERLAVEAQAGGAVSARAEAALSEIHERLGGGGGEASSAHRVWLGRRIARLLGREAPPTAPPAAAAEPPPGSPIGASGLRSDRRSAWSADWSCSFGDTALRHPGGG